MYLITYENSCDSVVRVSHIGQRVQNTNILGDKFLLSVLRVISSL